MMVLMCREFGWTFEQFNAQPWHEILWAWDFLNGERRGQNARAEQESK